MKLALASLIFFSGFGLYRSSPMATSKDQELTEKSVLEWADKTFEFYDGPRFEKFQMIPSNEYFKIETQVEGLKEYKEELKAGFQAGEIKKTKEEFDAQLKKLDRKIDSLTVVMNSSINKAMGFEIDFWANIMVNNGLTVYYVHHMKLDAKYAVQEGKVTGSIGKENDKIHIIYKKAK